LLIYPALVKKLPADPAKTPIICPGQPIVGRALRAGKPQAYGLIAGRSAHKPPWQVLPKPA